MPEKFYEHLIQIHGKVQYQAATHELIVSDKKMIIPTGTKESDYLNSLKENTYTIGLAFHEQIMENNVIPMNSNDIYINEILFSNENK